MKDFPPNKWLGERLRLFPFAALSESTTGRKLCGKTDRERERKYLI